MFFRVQCIRIDCLSVLVQNLDIFLLYYVHFIIYIKFRFFNFFHPNDIILILETAQIDFDKGFRVVYKLWNLDEKNFGHFLILRWIIAKKVTKIFNPLIFS